MSPQSSQRYNWLDELQLHNHIRKPSHCSSFNPKYILLAVTLMLYSLSYVTAHRFQRENHSKDLVLRVIEWGNISLKLAQKLLLFLFENRQQTKKRNGNIINGKKIRAILYLFIITFLEQNIYQ